MADRSILLRPSPGLSPELLPTLARAVADITGAPVRIGRLFEPSPDTYDITRGQYRGEEILRDVCAQRHVQDGDVVALIDHDCFGETLNYVFGQASLHAGCAFVALKRLRSSSRVQRNDEGLFVTRVIKEIVHEVGHTRGLLHCPDPRCIMHFSNCLEDTDRKGPRFCPLCRKTVDEQR